MRAQKILLLTIAVMFLVGCASPATPVVPTVAPTQTPISLQPGEEAIEDVSLTEMVSLEGKWRFKHIERFDAGMTMPEYDDSSWEEVDAPAPWTEQGLGNLTATGAVVIYRLKVQIPAEWKERQIGINAWFNPFYGRVYINGQAVEPLRKPYACYAEISKLLKFGEVNTIAVTTQYDGYLLFTAPSPLRIGMLVERAVTKIVHEDIKINSKEGEVEATLIYPEKGKAMAGLVLDSSGTHGLAEREPWFNLADDLARQGIVSLVLVPIQQTPERVQAGVEYLRTQENVNPPKIALFGVDLATEAILGAAVADTEIAGVILLSPTPTQFVSKLGNRPILLMASQDDRHGLGLKQAQDIAAQASGKVSLVTLPGDGRGTFVFTGAWNQVRTALLAWLTETGILANH